MRLSKQAAASGLPYAPLCAGQLYLRNVVAGHQTSLERVTDFLRDHVWRGDHLIALVKREFYQDAFVEKGMPATLAPKLASTGALLPVPAPTEALEHAVVPQRLALETLSDFASERLFLCAQRECNQEILRAYDD